MTPAPSLDREGFLANLRKSGLVTADEVDSLASVHPELTRGKALARRLVERGSLTRFQAERLLAGRTGGMLIGPYRILDLLGEGGMGRVYKAEHRAMGRVVALKVLTSAVTSSERAVQLFRHEARAVAVLQHPNIVAAYDANECGGKCYLVLEFVDGPNLEQLIRRQGPLPVGTACDYVRQAALGLQFAHRLGMVHRDIKPANLLLQSRAAAAGRGQVKVSDFGLARLAAPPEGNSEEAPATLCTRPNTVMGTPDYLSPEQSRDLHATDIRADLYSLGCTFHFLLTGDVPFPGGGALEKVIRHIAEVPVPVSTLRGDVPREVAAIVSRLMAKCPEERFATPADLAQVLEPFAREKRPGAELVSGDEPTVAVKPPAATEPGEATPPVRPSRLIERPRTHQQGPSGNSVLVAVGVAVSLVVAVALLLLVCVR